MTCNVPLIIHLPGISVSERIDSALHYHNDWAVTAIELLGGTVPANWNGKFFADAFRKSEESGVDYVVTSQGMWSCQWGVRCAYEGEDYICLLTYHDGYKELDPVMLFNLTQDPHEQHNLSAENRKLSIRHWHGNAFRVAAADDDQQPP